MKIHKISLDERIRRIKSGYASDPQFYISAIKSFANIPIMVYLNAFPDEMQNLFNILGIEDNEKNAITYMESAFRIYQMRKLPKRKFEADEAVLILSLPLRKCYEERKFAYGKSAKDIT